MPCYFPLQGFRSRFLNSSGKRSIVFSASEALGTSEVFRVSVPCGQCIGCRLERSRQWAIRCLYESKFHDDNCFITLTFDKFNLPQPPSLDVKVFQRFMKRLRKAFPSKRIRYFHCGEYGEKFGRPHYHCLLFGLDFKDKVYLRTVNGSVLYRSPTLEKLWPFGYSSIGAVTFESAAYVARYVMKKVTGAASEMFYAFCPKTGEIFDRAPEYVTMSRRPGIGRAWYDKFARDVYPSDEILLRRDGIVVHCKPPKYYDSLFEAQFPIDFLKVKSSRIRTSVLFKQHNTPERLAVRHQIKLTKLNQLLRNLDADDFDLV